MISTSRPHSYGLYLQQHLYNDVKRRLFALLEQDLVYDSVHNSGKPPSGESTLMWVISEKIVKVRETPSQRCTF